MSRHILLFIFLVASVDVSAQQQRTIALTLKQECGRAVYRDCRLDVTAGERPGHLKLMCALNTDNARTFVGEDSLSPEEMATLEQFLIASKLCIGRGDGGTDSRAVDGVLETLQVECGNGGTAVVTTSGNPTFVGDTARAQLLKFLHNREDALKKTGTIK